MGRRAADWRGESGRRAVSTELERDRIAVYDLTQLKNANGGAGMPIAAPSTTSTRSWRWCAMRNAQENPQVRAPPGRTRGDPAGYRLTPGRVGSATVARQSRPCRVISPDMTALEFTRRQNHLVRRTRGLSEAARADRHSAWLFVRPAAGAFRRNACDLDDRERGESSHHRALCPGRPALHAQIPVGAAGRCARHPDPVARARAQARLARLLAAAACLAILFLAFQNPSAVAVAGRARRRDGGDRVGDAGHRDRRLPRRKPRYHANRPPAWRAMSQPTASACWLRARA